MPSEVIRVLVVDDSAYVRKVVSQMLLRSPFIEVGTFVRVKEPWMITLGVSFEDDIRFDSTPNTGYVSVLLGFGAVAYSSGGGFLRPWRLRSRLYLTVRLSSSSFVLMLANPELKLTKALGRLRSLIPSR